MSSHLSLSLFQATILLFAMKKNLSGTERTTGLGFGEKIEETSDQKRKTKRRSEKPFTEFLSVAFFLFRLFFVFNHF